jgi:hypothetical protein
MLFGFEVGCSEGFTAQTSRKGRRENKQFVYRPTSVIVS